LASGPDRRDFTRERKVAGALSGLSALQVEPR